MTVKSKGLALVDAETQKLLDWATQISDSDETYFHKAQSLARRLGAHYRSDGLTEVGFWTPRLAGEVIQSERDIFLEVFTPLSPIDFSQPEQSVQFRCDRVPLTPQGEFVWGVIEGMQPGTKHQAGSFYWLRAFTQSHLLRIIRDPLPYSLPYGVFAPAELYDGDRLQRQRLDLAYFQQTARPKSSPELEIPRVEAPRNILQLHVGTASPNGTVRGLTEIYQRISRKLAEGLPLTPAEEHYVGYDAVQLLPMEPTIEYRLEGDNFKHEFFAISDSEHGDLERWSDNRIVTDEIPTFKPSETLTAVLRKPDTQNWGYDVPILGSSATNPALLESLRPDEMVELIETLHTFSTGPIQLIYDLVYGHADNQAEDLLNRQFLKGPNMYGQDLNHQLPMVRAILLEMQRRKINTGADGIRVDGGQDFRWFNPLTGRVEQDDTYLLAMSDLVQEIGDCDRLLFTIFEDGRPWPQEGWEETSTYRDLIELKPESYQWGPLIFAHNTPALEKFWDRKWRRVSEVMIQGANWITGCANHDTVRRGNQIACDADMNWNLGETLPQILHKAYDNPAVMLWVYGFSPGLPMDFINALMHAPWMFFRNTDDRYGVKVVAEEMGFLNWQIEPDLYTKDWAFPQLKALGFDDFGLLKQFMQALSEALIRTDYDLEAVAQICQRCLGAEGEFCELPSLGELNPVTNSIPFLRNLTVPALKEFAMGFMEDAYQMCHVSHYWQQVDAVQSRFNRQLRAYRHGRAWLRQNLSGSDRFNRISDNHCTIFYGLRTNPSTALPDEGEPVAMVAHMGGDPITVTLGDWLQMDMQEWQVAIATPGLNLGTDAEQWRSFELSDSQGVLFTRQP
jgi:hypothetical protein